MTIERNRDEILRIAARHGARNVRVFGSVARGEDRFDSDVDLLVEMQDDRSLLDLVGLEQELEELLQCKVDVLTDASIHPAIRQRISAEARALGRTSAFISGTSEMQSTTSSATPRLAKRHS